MRPPGAKRGAAPFGGAESHELRLWARLRRAGCAPAPCLPPMLSPPAAFAPSPPALTQTPALAKPPSSPSRGPKNSSQNPKTSGFRPPRRARCAGAKGRSPFRLRRKPRASLVGPPAAGGLRPCPLPSPNAFPSRCFRSLSPCTHSNPRPCQAPFFSLPRAEKLLPKSQNIRLSPAPPRPLRGRQRAQPLSAPPKATSFARGPALRAGGLRPCPLPSPNAPNQKTPPQPFTDYGGAFICGISSRH